MHPTSYRGCWHVVSRCFLCRYHQNLSLLTEFYTPRGFITHAALLRQAFAHCAKFPTAASRRSMGRVSVPLWLIILSNQLLIVALVVHYTTNKLIRCRLILKRKIISRLVFQLSSYGVLAVVSNCCPPLAGRFPTYYSPVRHFPQEQALASRSTCMY